MLIRRVTRTQEKRNKDREFSIAAMILIVSLTTTQILTVTSAQTQRHAQHLYKCNIYYAQEKQ